MSEDKPKYIEKKERCFICEEARRQAELMVVDWGSYHDGKLICYRCLASAVEDYAEVYRNE